MTYIRKSVEGLEAYTPGEQPADANVIKLNTNENPYPPSPSVQRILREFDLSKLRRYPDPVSTSVRQRIAELHGCSLDQVFAGNGSDEVLALSLRAFVERNQAVGYFDPTYTLYSVLADIEDVAKRPVSLTESFEWQDPPLDTALFLMANPNAPTGMNFARDRIHAFVRSYPGVVVIDEAYAEFADTDCVDLLHSCPNVLVARTLSKSYSLAGIRFGYALGSKQLVEALYKIKDSYNVNALTQELALAALHDVEHMRGNVDRVRATRGRVVGALASLGFEVSPSQANFVWAKPASVTAAELFEALKSRGIYIRYFPGPRTGQYVRITVGTDDDMDRFLEVTRDLVGS